jgi:UDP-2-acetamido-2,6-beta-L-arabino-hexul-4-ose reductase
VWWAKKSAKVIYGFNYPKCFLDLLSNYNSVVATFSHKMARNETPKIDVDGDLKLIYVGELVNEILKRNSFRRER